MTSLVPDRGPRLVVIAGPNGAGKTTFFYSHVAPSGLQFVNADQIAAALGIDAYAAAETATTRRRELVARGESFAFETVFSDPVGDKVDFIQQAGQAGYWTLLCFIGIPGPAVSEERVAQRVADGGHDVPHDRLVSRYPRTMSNLRRSIAELPLVMVFDNTELMSPHRRVAVFEKGVCTEVHKPLPPWFRAAAKGLL